MEPSEEEKKLLASFRELDLKPKGDSKEDLHRWLTDYATLASGSVKKEPDSQPTLLMQAPRLSVFNGSSGRKDAEATYDLWKYEVNSLLQAGTRRSDLMDAVRRSLRGEAARVAMRLGTGATLEDLLAKFDSIYGTVQQKESVLAQFYSARQREGEDVATWSCRLEDLLMQAESLGKVEPADRNDKLRTMFWTGLLPHLRDKSGHKFDAITDFDRLRVEIRRMEQYDPLRETEKKPAVNKMAKSSAVSKEDPKGQKLEARIQQLTAEIERLKKQQAEPDAPTSYRDRRGGSRGRGRGWGGQQSASSRAGPAGEDEDVPTCYRCGEKGHIRVGCRVRLDHSAKHLNGKGPTGKGGL
ncbi:hypothetical protein BaRGS_00005860 [Batillaria attramentaria]|uniref:CCHC-type domain-containing protein n=1 Tax=Batillaria attramentaria TaxID=370345 RepID=A0ABD0LUI0_9CAEN|nr:hypothetical protein BaRGS_027017 [Batillaria attramentaria]